MVSNFPNLDLQWAAIKPTLSQEFQGVVISLSGGPDSTALLRLFCEFAKRKKNLKLHAVHLNFGLRGEDSDRDELFCRNLCKTHNVPIQIRKVDKESIPTTGSIQEWARDIRIGVHREYLDKHWIIATAHHQDDLAENIIFRLIRGFSAPQLPGMQVWNGTHWRPFLACPKNDLLVYLETLKQDFRHDASNDGRDYTRNKIRHDIMPLLNAIAPNAASNICNTGIEAAAIGREFINSALNKQARQSLTPLKLAAMDRDAARFLVKSLIFSLINNTDLRLSRQALDKIVSHYCADSGQQESVDIGKDLAVTIDSGRISITKRRPDIKSKRILQYAQQINTSDTGALVGFGSHVFLRDLDAVWCAGPSGKSRSHSLEFEVKNARSGNKVKLPGWKTGRTLKNIFQELSVPLDRRSGYRVITKNGEQVGLFDGKKFISPANLAMQATIEGINFIISKKA